MRNAKGCAHYWVIETPTGPVSRGSCLKCGKVQMFPNTTELSWRERAKVDAGLHQSPYGERAVRVKAFRNYY